MKVDSYPSENTYELYKGRGDSGDLIASVDQMPVSNSLYYLDNCLNDDIYTFYAIDSYGDGWDISTGYMLTVDVGATIFEVKGVFFAAYDGVFDVADVAYQHGGTQRFVGFVEVGADASFQVLGFAHIDDVPFFVEVLVYSGRIGEE